MRPAIMLVGLGDLGGVILELLAREPWVGRIVACSRRAGPGEARCNLARLGAMAQGLSPDIRHVPIDLNHEAAVAEVVARERPDLICSSATLQTWWLAETIPGEQAARLRDAGFGIWLPIHLTLTHKLMRALHDAGFGGVTLTAPFPDVVNCVLGRLGLAPTCGVGNLDEVVPKVRLLAAARLGAPLEALRVWLVAHHALGPLAFRAGPGAPPEAPPYYLRVERDGRDVTREAGGADLLFAPYPLTGGPAWGFLTAGSAVRLMRAVLAPEETFLHAPGPHGLPGGYPVLAGRREVRPAPVPGLTAEEAVAINERSHRYDGIERVEKDGTVVFTERAAGVLREVLGYEAGPLRPRDSADRARELLARFREFAARQGVTLPERTGNA
jgi:hypothetical protein